MAYYIYSDRRRTDCIGMYDENGYVYRGRAWFDGGTPSISDCVGKFDRDGYVYHDYRGYESSCVGMIDRDGKVYQGRGWFQGSTPGTAPIGYVDHNGEVYDQVGFFDDRPPSGSWPVAYTDGPEPRSAGAAALLLLLGDGATSDYDAPSHSGGSYARGGGGGGGVGGALSALAAVVVIVLLIGFVVGKLILPSRAERQAEEARAAAHAAAQAEVERNLAQTGMEELGDGHYRYTGYFAEGFEEDSVYLYFEPETDCVVNISVSTESSAVRVDARAGQEVFGVISPDHPEYPINEPFAHDAWVEFAVEISHEGGTGFYYVDVVLESAGE